MIKNELIQLENVVKEFDITIYWDRQIPFNVDENDAFFFGFPIYAWRAPIIIRDWLQTLDGKNKKCSVFFTYGGISSGIAHYDIKQILDKQGFQLVSTAEFLGKHSFNIGGWSLMEDRPNQQDFEVAKDYVLKTYKRFMGEDSALVKFPKPKYTEDALEKVEKNPKKAVKPPNREGDCSMCRLCEEECPVNAINADLGIADKDNCIRCLRCVDSCPDNALRVNDLAPAYKMTLALEKLTEDIIKKKKSKIFL